MKFDHLTASTRMDSRLGPIVLAASAQGLCGLWFEGQKHQPDPSGWPRDDRHPTLRAAADAVHAYLDGDARGFDIPLDLQAGTTFQQAVWRTLIAIPRGRTLGYADVGRHIGQPSAARAVGAAVGRNPISIIVPCHRVLGLNGALTGYAGGIERKVALLNLEGVL
ncbi:MAG: methylated-DNA--[protein]-cysteine S-methyltransferase [Betaproteobacteria bacterium]|nr:methylated-DNA--[protein]-cysteine S-methyltransferase [Betaproteobacteria bacterium]